MNDCKVSIIVPVYNAENYLRRCVDSILSQTYKDFELILVNDGSTDGSQAICEDYARSDNRISVIKKENGGGEFLQTVRTRIDERQIPAIH